MKNTMKNTMKNKPATVTTSKKSRGISSGREIMDQGDVSVPLLYASDRDIQEEFLEMTRYTSNDTITAANYY